MKGEPLYFAEDSYLRQLVNSAERKRRWYHRMDWFKVAVWIGLAAFCWLFWYGVARAI